MSTSTAQKKPLKHPIGKGIYPSYDALWHLEALGLGMADSLEGGSADAPHGWVEAANNKTATKIALIDTGAASDHPNLHGVINDKHSIDFTTTPYRKPSGTQPETAASIISDIEDAVAEYIKQGTPPTNTTFGSHGTAMAGIIGARPAVSTEFQPPETGLDGSEKVLHARLMALPYAGVDPTCEIIPVSIGAQPNPEQIIAAFKYAAALEVDLIVIATDLPNPMAVQEPHKRSVKALKNADKSLRESMETQPVVEVSDLTRELWLYLAGALPRISKEAPIICAAGNTPDRVVFPANLAADDNAIFAVGAVRRDRLIASYSPGRGEDQNITVYAYSGDGERFDRIEMRWDIYRNGFGIFEEAPWRREDVSEYKACEISGHETLISTDVPGRFGYNGSAYDEPRVPGHVDINEVAPDATPDDPGARALLKILGKQHEIEVYTDFASNFCRFSGTSAASALFAGLVSLGLSSGTLKKGFARHLKSVLADQAHPVASWTDIVEAGQKQ